MQAGDFRWGKHPMASSRSVPYGASGDATNLEGRPRGLGKAANSSPRLGSSRRRRRGCRMGCSILARVVVVGALTGAYAAEATPVPPPSEAQAVTAFEARVKEYLALHRKLESTLPNLPRRHTPEQVDKNHRALGELIKTARRAAKPGELFTPGMP